MLDKMTKSVIQLRQKETKGEIYMYKFINGAVALCVALYVFAMIMGNM